MDTPLDNDTRNKLFKAYDMEQHIMDCWCVCDDLKLVAEFIDSQDKMSMENLSKILHGMQQLYQLKFERLFSDHEQLIKTIRTSNED